MKREEWGGGVERLWGDSIIDREGCGKAEVW